MSKYAIAIAVAVGYLAVAIKVITMAPMGAGMGFQ